MKHLHVGSTKQSHTEPVPMQRKPSAYTECLFRRSNGTSTSRRNSTQKRKQPTQTIVFIGNYGITIAYAHMLTQKHNTAFHLESYLSNPVYKKAGGLTYLLD